jgi:hypothetical protein
MKTLRFSYRIMWCAFLAVVALLSGTFTVVRISNGAGEVSGTTGR